MLSLKHLKRDSLKRAKHAKEKHKAERKTELLIACFSRELKFEQESRLNEKHKARIKFERKKKYTKF